jgi:hypothetical protein
MHNIILLLGKEEIQVSLWIEAEDFLALRNKLFRLFNNNYKLLPSLLELEYLLDNYKNNLYKDGWTKPYEISAPPSYLSSYTESVIKNIGFTCHQTLPQIPQIP